MTNANPAPAPKLTADGAAKLQAALETFATDLPGCCLTVTTPDGVLFEGAAGKFDVLDPEGRDVATDDVMFFASTTKLLTAVCYLQLVDRGALTLDTDMRTKFAPLDKAAANVITGFDDEGQPILTPNDKPVLLSNLLNQTSGFGMEFGEVVPKWKKTAKKGTGFVNSCKVENLINTPLCYVPGTSYEYGNSAEWLGLMLPEFTGMEVEDYFQANILRPLGMKHSSFYPFDDAFAFQDKLMPLRFKSENGFEVLKDQLPLLTLPRKREEIEYPVCGGGLYSNCSDYARLLQHLLRHYLSLSGQAERPSSPILSDKTVTSLFSPSLPEAALKPFAEFFSRYLMQPVGEDDGNWTTAMAIWKPADGRRRGGHGRHAGSVGWGGAAGTSYWMDPKAGIAVVFTSQVLPGASTKPADAALENAVYAALGMSE